MNEGIKKDLSVSTGTYISIIEIKSTRTGSLLVSLIIFKLCVMLLPGIKLHLGSSFPESRGSSVLPGHLGETHQLG